MLAIERLADDLMRTGEQLLRFPDFFGDSSSVYPEDRPSRRALKRRREGDIDLFTTSSLWQKWRPVTDIAETDDATIIYCELPGVAKEDVKVDYNDGVLTISGERQRNKKVKQENFVRTERFYGSFSRSFNVGDVDPSTVNASFKDGVLEVTIPKPKTAPKRHVVPVK